MAAPEALPSTILFVPSFFSPVLESWLLHTTYVTLQISSGSHEPISWELPPRGALPPELLCQVQPSFSRARCIPKALRMLRSGSSCSQTGFFSNPHLPEKGGNRTARSVSDHSHETILKVTESRVLIQTVPLAGGANSA